jgi:2-polyprenyl-3-methyl-5-hydroxy-6-metoxy-1,4-benzoquinol methylase
MDKSNGYEECAQDFMRARRAHIGPDVVREWAHEFPPGSEVLELACGHGVVSQVLVDQGLRLYAIDASPTLLKTFRERFPDVETECSAAEDSSYFGRTFDGVVAWGLMFLLPEETQRTVLAKMANALKPGGRLLFTAPSGAVTWMDSLTGLESRSLSAEEYESQLRDLGFDIEPGRMDVGENYYYLAKKRG